MAETNDERQPPDHLYIHVPLCDGKCFYCGFYSALYTPEASRGTLAALEEELRLSRGEGPRPAPVTIYIGGGTPTMLAAGELDRLCRAIAAHVCLDRLREWTVEANPASLSADKLLVLTTAGVNRISLGAQSFDDGALVWLGRRHRAADTMRSVDLIRAAGIANFGLDLIAGLPEEHARAWAGTLRTAVSLQPAHLSAYVLSADPGTPLRAGLDAGEVRLPDEAEQLRVLGETEGVLADAGYARYEISNFARPGAECRHNLSFWQGGDYLGIGPAAASRVGRRRWTNAPDLRAYAAALAAARPPPREEETLSERADRAERFAFHFRTTRGADPAAFAGNDATLRDAWERALARLREHGLVERTEGLWRPTAAGFCLADRIAEELLEESPLLSH